MVAESGDKHDSEDPAHSEVYYGGRDCLPGVVVDCPESDGFIEEPLRSEMVNSLQDLETIA